MGFNAAWFITFAVALALVAADMLMSEQGRKSFGKFCLIGAAILALVGFWGVGTEIQKHWSEPGTGTIAYILAFNAVLWIALVWAILRYWKDARRAEQVEGEILALKKRLRAPDFKVSKAEWGKDHKRAQVEDAINQMPPNALAFFLCPDAFKAYTTPENADPSPGPGKAIDITYSSGAVSGTVRRKEGDWVVLPEDPWLKNENDQLAKEAQRLKDELEPLKKKEAKATAKHQQDAETLKNAPRLFIEHEHDGNRDVLMLRNDKDEDARYTGFQALQTLVEDTISSAIVMPIIEGGGPVKEIPIEVYSGATGQLTRLWELLGEHQKNKVHTVRVYYQGKQGNSTAISRSNRKSRSPLLGNLGPSVCLPQRRSFENLFKQFVEVPVSWGLLGFSFLPGLVFWLLSEKCN